MNAVSINNKRPYEVNPIPTAPTVSLGPQPQPKGKGILINVTMQIPFTQIYEIMKQMFGKGLATPEDLQQAAAELRKVADMIEDLATSIP